MQLRLLFAVGADLQPPGALSAEPRVGRAAPLEADAIAPSVRRQPARIPQVAAVPARALDLRADERRLDRRPRPRFVPRPAPTGPFVAESLRVGRFSFADGLGGELPILLDVTV